MAHRPLNHRDADLFKWARYYIKALVKMLKSEHDRSHGAFCICDQAMGWVDDVLKVNNEKSTTEAHPLRCPKCKSYEEERNRPGFGEPPCNSPWHTA